MQAGEGGLRSISFGMYTSKPKLHCGTVDRYFSVSVLSRNHWEREGGQLFRVYIGCLYVCSNRTGVKQSPRVGRVVLCITRTIYYHAQRAPFTAFHFNISSMDASGCDPSVLSQHLGKDVSLDGAGSFVWSCADGFASAAPD